MNLPCSRFGCVRVKESLIVSPFNVTEHEMVCSLVLVKLMFCPWLERTFDVEESVPLQVPLVPVTVDVEVDASASSYEYEETFTSYVYSQVAETAHEVSTFELVVSENDDESKEVAFNVISPSLTSCVSV